MNHFNNKPIYVTQPFMPPLDEFNSYLNHIWDNKVLTNNGQFHQQLEKELCDYLGVKYISLFTNGTIALITALKTLEISGEVITTPYSFVATAHSLLWNNIKPVFCDIEPNYLNIDVDRIESLITNETKAIMPVHVYGNPCEVTKISNLAKKYNLKVIYDACHSFGVKKDGESILNFGDLSIVSFHATKVFNTFEGGAIICHDEKTKKRIDFLKNFGFADEVTVLETGINGKMNEIQAAFGLLQLKYLDNNIEKRNNIAKTYRTLLNGINGIQLLEEQNNTKPTYNYFPILVTEQYKISRDDLYNHFKTLNIFTRRYFYPLISEFPMFSNLQSSNHENLSIATLKSKQILCLPIYPDLDIEVVKYICSEIKRINEK